ncbi:MAG: DsbA family protein [Acidobacteria bacterium]|nr:DsbA family protein [Acidobacteriota bacterium]
MSANQPAGAKRYLPFIIIAGVLVAVVAAALLLSRSSDTNQSAPLNLNSGLAAGTPNPGLPGAQPPHVKGDAAAPVTLEEFGDYQCPPCGILHPALQKIEDDYGSRVRLVFRNFPLQMHKNASTAARAAEAAAVQGKFWEMHDMIYEHQDEWKDLSEPRTVYANYASRLDLDVEKFKSDMEKPETGARIVSDYRRGISLGVSGTPTIFLNGRNLPAEQTLDPAKLRAEIDAALAGKTQ